MIEHTSNETFKKGYSKAAALCSRAEKCSHDVEKKLRDWGYEDEFVVAIIDKLIEDRFIDDERFARSYVRDKFRFNRWGKIKIGFMLRQKLIPQFVIDDVLYEEISDDAYFEMLCDLIQSGKRRYRKAEGYDLKVKLVRFATFRGFSSDIVFRAIEHVGLDGEEA